jgi:DHA3 family macrolide efflux protein-like MFS transporter
MDIQSNNWTKRFAAFLSGQMVSLFGSALVQYAIIWHVTLKTQSGIAMMVVSLCSFVPHLIISTFAGVWADRYSRKFLIIFGDAMIAAFTLALAILYSAGFQHMWLLYAMTAIRSVGGGIQMPAVGAVFPQLVPTEKLTRANGIYGSIQGANMILAPAASAALIGYVPLQYIFYIDVVTAAIAILIMANIRIERPEQHAGRSDLGFFADLKAGFRHVRDNKWLLIMFGYYAAIMMNIAPIAMLSPLMVARTYGGGEFYLAVIEIAFSAGTILGGVLIAAWGGFKNRFLTIALCSLAIGVMTLACGIVISFVFFSAMMLLIGVLVPVYSTPTTVLLQEKVGPEMQGRVFGIMGIVSSSAMPIGMLIYAPISDRAPMELLLVISGALIAIASAGMLFSKELRAHGEKPEPAKP